MGRRYVLLHSHCWCVYKLHSLVYSCSSNFALTESQEDASSRSLEGAKHMDDIPSVGGSLSSISFLLPVAMLLPALFHA